MAERQIIKNRGRSTRSNRQLLLNPDDSALASSVTVLEASVAQNGSALIALQASIVQIKASAFFGSTTRDLSDVVASTPDDLDLFRYNASAVEWQGASVLEVINLVEVATGSGATVITGQTGITTTHRTIVGRAGIEVTAGTSLVLDSSALQVRVSALETSTAGLANSVSVLTASVAQNASVLGVHTGQISDLFASTAANQSAINVVSASLIAFESATASDFAVTNASVTANASSIMVLSASLTAFEAATASDFVVTNASVAANQSAINVVSASLTAFESATSSNFSITNASVAANESALNVVEASLLSFESATSSNFAITNASTAANASSIVVNTADIATNTSNLNCDRQMVTANASIFNSSTVYADMGFGIFTKDLGGLGTYLIDFNAKVDISSDRDNLAFRFVIGGSVQTDSSCFMEGARVSGLPSTVSAQYLKAGLSASTEIKMQWKHFDGAATGTVTTRRLVLNGVPDNRVI